MRTGSSLIQYSGVILTLGVRKVRKRGICLFLMIGLAFPTLSQANLVSDFGGGLELAGFPTVLLSDMSVGATGFGIGSNIGAYLISRTNDPFGLKLRFDRYFSRQEALGRAESSDLAANSYYKSWTQQYFLISTGVEWRQKMNSHWSYFEALLGYGLGVRGTVEWTSKDPSVNGGEIGSKGLPLENRFLLMAGWGYRRAFHKDFSLVAGIRTFLPIGAPYGGALEGKTIVPLPLILSIGAQYR